MSRAATLLLAIVFLSACDSSAPEAITPEVIQEPQAVLLPLAVGNTWTYRTTRTSYMEDGVTVRSVDSVATPSVLSITGTEVVAGETWYRASATGDLVPVFDGLFFSNRTDGLYVRRDGRATLQYQFPATAGTQFGRSFWSGDYDHPEGLSIDSDVTLKVTDLPVTVGTTAYEGYLFTGATRRFRFSNGQSVEVDPLTAPFHDLLVPNVGFARYENGYFALLSPNVMRITERLTFSLQSVSLVAEN